MSTLTLAEAHRRNLADLTVLAQRDLSLILQPLDDREVIRFALLTSLPDLVSIYGSAAATLAADAYDEMRDDAEITGRYLASPTTLPDTGRTDSLARWAIQPLYQPDPDKLKMIERASGGLQRTLGNASRYTIAHSAVDDPKADGWQRIGRGGCGFCAMLIARGAVYSKRSADFASHDHCNCSAAPAFAGMKRPVQPYTPSPRKASEADRARVREYLRTH